MVRGNGFGVAALALMALSFIVLLGSIGNDDARMSAPGLILYVVLPLIGCAMLLAIIGLFRDRRPTFAGISLCLIPGAIFLGSFAVWVSGGASAKRTGPAQWPTRFLVPQPQESP